MTFPSTPHRQRGLTLIEVTVALSILVLLMAGIFATLMQSRRLTESSIGQNAALTLVQGYMEQLKTMPLKDVVHANVDPAAGGVPDLTVSYDIPTRFKEPPASGTDDGTDPLTTSTGTPPALSSITPGVTPTGVKDNLKNFAVSTSTRPAAVAWSTLWPGAQNYPTPSTTVQTSTAYPSDMQINLWIWIQDLSGTTTYAADVYGITIIYTFRSNLGGSVRYHTGSIRSVRSAIPSF